MESYELSQAIAEKIDGRQVTHALFTSYTFDPEFFEQEVLPLLVPRTYSNAPGIRAFQLQQELRSVSEVEVYYDYNVFRAERSPHQNYARIPVRMGGLSCFHAKVTLLLIKNLADDTYEEYRSLLMIVGSGNLTRAGFWENLECFHIEEIEQGQKTPFREGLLDILRSIKRADSARGDRERGAFNEIRKFAGELGEVKSGRKAAMYGARQSFPDFLQQMLGVRSGPWFLEIISPYFSEKDSGVHEALIKRLKLKRVRVYLPYNDAGEALCSEKFYNAIEEHPVCEWAHLKDDNLLEQDRALHAKVYRFYSPALGEEIIFTGSVNFTLQAFGINRRTANIEAGILVKSEENNLKPMLQKLEEEPGFAKNTQPDSGGGAEVLSFIALSYDWEDKCLKCFTDSDFDMSIRISDNNGPPFTVYKYTSEQVLEWVALDVSSVADLEEVLNRTSFLTVQIDDGILFTVIVQEEGMILKPSLAEQMTPGEILEYWSLLDEDEKTSFVARLIQEKYKEYILPEDIEAVTVTADNSFFSQFSQVYQGFNRLQGHLDRALHDGNIRDFEYYLFGNDMDSLASLVRKVQGEDALEDYLKYIIGLCSRGVYDKYLRQGRYDKLTGPSMAKYRNTVATIDKSIECLCGLKSSIELGQFNSRRRAFFSWFEKYFFMEPVE